MEEDKRASVKNIESFYVDNIEYSRFLEQLDKELYRKYIRLLEKFAKNYNTPRILDVGCGTGYIVDYFTRKGYEIYGVDISRSSIEIAKKTKKGHFRLMLGNKIPFPDNFFDVVGSFTVIEHTKDPEQHISEIVRVTKRGGTILIACPNFFNVLTPKSHHWHTKGIKRRIKNFIDVLRKYIQIYQGKSPSLKFVEPILTKDFIPDSDAVYMANPVDIRYMLQKNSVKIIYSSGALVDIHPIYEVISRLPFVKDILGGVFIIGRKL